MDPAFVFRPVSLDDLDQIRELVGCISGGMTSLPDRPNFLEERINDSRRAFDHRINKPAGEVYLFVLEELRHRRIVGTSGLLSRVGGFDPFYTYKIRNSLQEYEPLSVHKSVQTLELVKNHKGPSEICSLFLHPQYRHSGIGRLLSLSRFCFIKALPERFDKEIIAELRGYLDAKGRSPFWEAVGKNFFWSDYYQADVLSGIGEKDFIEALMPEFPIYVSLLPKSAQSVIGKVHPQTEPARRILIKEGFLPTDQIDIFDGGPILKARREDLRTWQGVRNIRTRIVDTLPMDANSYLLANGRLDFRSTFAPARIRKELVEITRPVAESLQVREGDSIQVIAPD
ncbi:MAG: arginine N-succinyltransferase [Opitutales bacterium]|jgi:arginine N-succinyltransferase